MFDNLSVFENIELAVLASARGQDASARIARVLRLVRLEHQTGILARNLSHGQRQWLEIGLLLANDAKLLLLDEPTAGMTAEETSATGELIRQLVAELQVAAIIIEHDINFIRRLRAPITVMHLGRVLVEERSTRSSATSRCARSISAPWHEPRSRQRHCRLRPDHRAARSLDAGGSGEVLGVLGRNGMGKSTLIRCLSGLIRPDSGRILFEGRDVTALATTIGRGSA